VLRTMKHAGCNRDSQGNRKSMRSAERTFSQFSVLTVPLVEQNLFLIRL